MVALCLLYVPDNRFGKKHDILILFKNMTCLILFRNQKFEKQLVHTINCELLK